MLSFLPSTQFSVLVWMMLSYSIYSTRADTIFIDFPPTSYTLPLSTALNIRYRIRYDGMANLQFAQVWVTGPERSEMENDENATTSPTSGILSNTTKPTLPPWSVETVWGGTAIPGTYTVHVAGTAMVNERGIQTPYPMEKHVQFSVSGHDVPMNNPVPVSSHSIRPHSYSYPSYGQPRPSSAHSLKRMILCSESMSAVLVGTAAFCFGYFLC